MIRVATAIEHCEGFHRLKVYCLSSLLGVLSFAGIGGQKKASKPARYKQFSIESLHGLTLVLDLGWCGLVCFMPYISCQMLDLYVRFLRYTGRSVSRCATKNWKKKARLAQW